MRSSVELSIASGDDAYIENVSERMASGEQYGRRERFSGHSSAYGAQWAGGTFVIARDCLVHMMQGGM